MKKLTIILCTILLAVMTAQAQISFYGEWCRKGSGKLDSKVWITPDYTRLEYYGEEEKKLVTLFDMKGKKAYIINDADKTCMVMEEIDKISTNKLLGYDLEVSSTVSREFLGMEEIDGKACAHYRIKSEALYKTGGTGGAWYNEWIYEPLISSNYNGCVAHDNTAYTMDRTLVLRSIRQGTQPAHLFKVPEGYKTTVVPAGGLLEMFTGKSREENTQNIENKAQQIKESMEAIKDKMNNSGNSQEDKMKALLELLGGSKKK